MSHPFGHIDDETPLDDVSGLIPDIGSRRELNAHEAANVLDAVLLYFGGPVVPRDGIEFDYTWMTTVHRTMFGKVWKWAGTTRRHDVNIAVAVDWPQVQPQLFDLCERIPYFLTTRRDPAAKPLTDIAYLHYELVRIHPFPNGNGRWSRFVANVYQIRFANTLTRWPVEMTGTAGDTSVLRTEYIAAMKSADAGNHAPLVELHERFTRPLPEM